MFPTMIENDKCYKKLFGFVHCLYEHFWSNKSWYRRVQIINFDLFILGGAAPQSPPPTGPIGQPPLMKFNKYVTSVSNQQSLIEVLSFYK